jgi:hypothetical protein
MCSDVAEDRSGRPYLERVVRGNRDVVRSRRLRGQADTASRLTSDPIAEATERPGEIRARQIARQLRAAMTSSRTKCSGITFGASPSSK